MIDCSKLETLRRVPVFEAWLDSGDTTCLEHLSRGEEVRLQSGQWLCHEGDEAAFYLVLEGELRVMKMVGDAEMLLTTHKPGVFFGEIPLMMGGRFVAGGQAAGEVVAYHLDAGRILGSVFFVPWHRARGHENDGVPNAKLGIAQSNA